ncbi:MAG: ATP synthase subunit I [Gemmiger sp.]|uniref:ATP synthase subunit I n=1 Tax=Gemmiger sp. TaxID=2049027 RepID=UPI002A91E33B|nr:ATP synthase subunit I [Gemmiger sp.]MDY5203133.1 ATP synthase subunit I [Gemmiger sp.]
MQKNRGVLRQVGGLAAALLVCIAVMLAVYALLGRLDRMVLLGAFFGWLLAIGNFLSLSITVSNALDRAANGGSPQKAQLEIQTSSVVRPLVLAVIYIVLFRAKVCDPVAALLPLLFAQVAIKVLEFFRNDKKGGDTAP